MDAYLQFQINICMNSDNRLYMYEDTVELVMTESAFYLDNRPMNNRKMQIHKGLTNELFFNVRNRDRKLQNVFTDTVRAYLIDPTTRRRVWVRYLEHTSDIGKLKLVLREEDMQATEAGLYTMYLTRSENQSDFDEMPFFADQNNNIRFDIEVTDQTGMQPVPTQVNADFMTTGNVMLGDAANTFVSSALYGNLERNFSNAQHTLAYYPENFTGNLVVQASCQLPVPDSDDLSWDWFPIVTLSHSEVVDQVQAVTFNVNCNWVRIVAYPETGTITQVQLRN